VVFADADMDTCVERSMWAVFANTGQDCCARSRIFVERPAYDGFLEALTVKTDALRVGQPLSEETDLGPLVSAGQRQTSVDYLDIGQKEGARLVTGGEVPEVPDGANGFYLRPAILADVDNAWRVAQEEIFGPVLVATPFDDVDDIAALANNTAYGLSASIWSNDLKRVHRLIPRIKAGTVWVNCHGLLDNALPFGGYKQSGIGREMGRAMIDLYTETKSVLMMQ
jgi:phenylacetaldehyde dehydrogenase